MARPFNGQAQVVAAEQLRDQARTAQQMRQALAVLLPLQCGLNLEQTAQVLGRSREVTCRLRNAFIDQHSGRAVKKAATPHLRRQRHAQHAAILDEVLGQAEQGGVVVVPPLKPAVEARLGKPICLATLYNMLHRHGWRKLAPDTVHPKGDAQAREDWKKNSGAIWSKFG